MNFEIHVGEWGNTECVRYYSSEAHNGREAVVPRKGECIWFMSDDNGLPDVLYIVREVIYVHNRDCPTTVILLCDKRDVENTPV